MRKNYLYIIVVIVSISCTASGPDGLYRDKSGNSVPTSKKDKSVPLLHVIDGAIYDLKGQYAEAILEYQDALSFDSSAGINYALSKDYYRLNKLASALSNALDAVRKEPENVEYRYLLAEIYSTARQEQEAVETYSEIIRIDSTEIQAYYNLGVLVEDDKPLYALEIYKKLLNLTGPEWNVLIKIADLNERLGNVEETISTVENLLKLDPSNLKLKKLLIEQYINAGRPDDAIFLVDSALLTYPFDLSLIEYKAHAYILKDEWKNAADEYMRIIQSENLPIENKVNIGKAFAGQCAIDTALIPIAKLIILTIDSLNEDWQIKAFLGEIAEYENDDSAAISYFSQAADLASWNFQIWVKLGMLLFDNQEYAEAAEKMKIAVGSFPDEFFVNIILGLSLSQLNQHAEAEQYLTKAVKLNPTDMNALSAYGFTLSRLGKDKEALVELNRALEIDPNNTQVLGMVGMIYDGLEMWDECDKHYERAIAIDSTDVLILNNYAYSLSERGKDLNRALEMAKKAINVEPENSSYLDTIGWIYFKLGVYKKAKEYISKAVEIEPNNATLLDHIGDVLFKLGNKEDALQKWQAAFEKDPSLEKVKKKIDTGEL